MKVVKQHSYSKFPIDFLSRVNPAYLMQSVTKYMSLIVVYSRILFHRLQAIQQRLNLTKVKTHSGRENPRRLVVFAGLEELKSQPCRDVECSSGRHWFEEGPRHSVPARSALQPAVLCTGGRRRYKVAELKQ